MILRNFSYARHPVLYYIRYLLLAKNSDRNDSDNLGRFDWINSPADVPDLFHEVNKEIAVDSNADDFLKALQIAAFLRNKTPVGPALSSSSERTLRGMLYGKGGVCSDFSMVFNQFCLLNKIPSKEWNCVDRFYKTTYGHTFNEIYSKELEKWIAIDAHKGIYFVDDHEVPLSVVDLFEGLRQDQLLNLRFISEYRPLRPERLSYVFSKTAIPFLTHNYKSAVNDYYLEKFRNLPTFVINAMLILLRQNYSFIFILDDYKQKLLPRYFRSG